MWPFSYIGNNRVVTEAKNGHHYIYDPHDLSVSLHLMLDGEHEPDISEMLDSLVRWGGRAAIVGSHIGYHDVHVAHKLGPDGRLYSFEPNEESFDMLHTNLIMNGMYGRTTTFNCAVLDHSGEATLHVLHRDSGGCSVDTLIPPNREKLLREIEVSCVTLDEVIPEGLDLLKIDAEGSEARVLAGARRLIERKHVKHIVLENNPDYFSGFLDEMVRWLHDVGYTSNVDRSLKEIEACDLLFSL